MKPHTHPRPGQRLFLSVSTSMFVMATHFALAETIDHTAIAGAASLPDATCVAIGQQRWLFTHASVGGNIMSGLDTLHASAPTRYRLIPEWIDVKEYGSTGEYCAADAPDTTEAGHVYECNRGNPDWDVKLRAFGESLEPIASGGGGWGVGKVGIVINKFCWIDPYAQASDYLSSMASLEALYPALQFVYTTMPLTGSADSENDLRNDFNDAVRQSCTANGKLLYDVADMEAWDPSGNQHTYSSGGKTRQLMYSGYADGPSWDDWHLNILLGQPRLALGWYATAAAIANGAPPTEARLDSFRAVQLTDLGIRVEWRTLVETQVMGFRIERTIAGAPWTPVSTGMVPAQGQNGPHAYSLVDRNASASASASYRLIEVDLRGRERVAALAEVTPGFQLRRGPNPTTLTLELACESSDSPPVEVAERLLGPWTELTGMEPDANRPGWFVFTLNPEQPARFFRVLTQ